MRVYTVYKITREDGGCVYVGATRMPLDKRLYQHLHAATRLGEWLRANKHYSLVEVRRYDDALAAQEHETRLIRELGPALNSVRTSSIATHAGGRKAGARNKKPTRTSYIYVRLTDELYDWVMAQRGKSESDKVVSILEDCRQNHKQRREKAS